MKFSEACKIGRKNDLLLLKIPKKQNSYLELGIFNRRGLIHLFSGKVKCNLIEETNFVLRRKNEIIG